MRIELVECGKYKGRGGKDNVYTCMMAMSVSFSGCFLTLRHKSSDVDGPLIVNFKLD